MHHKTAGKKFSSSVAFMKSERIDSMIGVIGWFSAKIRKAVPDSLPLKKTRT